MKKPTVFSLVREQSMFMTTIMGLLTFLSVLALGIAISIGTGVVRWNAQWDNTATVQVTNTKNIDATAKIIEDNRDKTKSIRRISDDEMADLMRPWISNGGAALKNYLPTMWEIEFKSAQDMASVQKAIDKNARFLTHASALKNSTSAGWKMIGISVLVLALTLGAIGISISYIARNTAMLHRRELEILTQIGASDAFVAHQMQIIVAKITSLAAICGFAGAVPVLMLVLWAARSARVGLMAMLGLSGFGWWTLVALPILIVVFAIFVTRRTTLNILKAE
ncbi:MAG: hypothetical protein IJD41_04530 [Alphaproteobacteria bacterium]|nr:hypothetical protein [Alphaproteobacteria bacterium]